MYRRSMKPHRPPRSNEPRKPQNCFKHCAFTYTVKLGDTLYKILSDFNVNIHELKRYNLHIRNLNHIIPGDVLCIPKPRPYCSFLTPTDSAPLDSYVVIAESNGIYLLANLPSITELKGDFDEYYAYAVNPFGKNFAKLSCISNNPTIWSGQINMIELNPFTRIYVSATNGKKKSDQANELILFEST
ncbi:MAG: LysM peptidoglycan-binding domain-containing protein [Maledivibacter sp.]|nr:LysM peptidoglycan-binding domain-containing protein [Maledivibacter sp.]